MKSQVSKEQAEIWALSGGEDYELCFTVPEINRGALDIALAHTGADFHCKLCQLQKVYVIYVKVKKCTLI